MVTVEIIVQMREFCVMDISEFGSCCFVHKHHTLKIAVLIITRDRPLDRSGARVYDNGMR